MPSNISFFKEFSATINGVMAETGVNAVKELSREVAQEIDQVYFNFFAELYTIISQKNTDTPARFGSNMGGAGPWTPLSERWSDRKLAGGGEAEFYYGLTAYAKTARRKAKRGGGRRKPRSKKAFLKFLGELGGSSRMNVKRFFGDVKVEYFISAQGRKKPINIEQTGNVITELSRITAHDNVGRMISNYGRVNLQSDITMFPLLAMASNFSEWAVVHMMAGKDKTNKAQWTKINSSKGFGRSNRPIRAMITPMISWYATTGIPAALRRFYT